MLGSTIVVERRCWPTMRQVRRSALSTIIPPKLVASPVVGRLCDLEVAGHLGEVLALARLSVGFSQLADDLLGVCRPLAIVMILPSHTVVGNGVTSGGPISGGQGSRDGPRSSRLHQLRCANAQDRMAVAVRSGLLRTPGAPVVDQAQVALCRRRLLGQDVDRGIRACRCPGGAHPTRRRRRVPAGGREAGRWRPWQPSWVCAGGR